MDRVFKIGLLSLWNDSGVGLFAHNIIPILFKSNFMKKIKIAQ